MWLNIAAFQIGWFACVLGGAHGMAWAGSAVALGVVALHLKCAPRPRPEALLIACAAVLGLIADTLLIRGGWLEFNYGIIAPGASPHWMVALWMIFATTLNVSLSWLKPRWLLASGFGAVGGPLAYYAGAKLGAVTLWDPLSALVAVAVAWAVAMPVLLWFADRFNGTQHSRQVPEVSCV
jgi:hypothetical protein